MVKIYKSDLVEHDGFPIWSVSIQPESKRIATCGGDSKVKIWDFHALLEGAQNKETSNTAASTTSTKSNELEYSLAVLNSHQGPVNCVRWSKTGSMLASCSDDKTVIVWELHPGQRQVFGENQKNIENWGVKVLLRGHREDVADLCWSPDCTKIASCSIDNTIIVWDVFTDNKKNPILHTLTGHNGYIKGIAWDPIGRYIASQGDDKYMIIWRATDYKVERRVTNPFKKANANVFFKRPSWSPDGSYLVAACAVKDSKHIAPIFRRSDFKDDKDFVGHSKAVVCTQWSPVTYKLNEKKSEPFFCCALGGQDNIVSIWATYKPRAVVVIKGLFAQSVLDLCWSSDGNMLVMCSGDGTLGMCVFSEGELGVRVPQDEVERELRNIYGEVTSNDNIDTIPEDPVQLQLQEVVSVPVSVSVT